MASHHGERRGKLSQRRFPRMKEDLAIEKAWRKEAEEKRSEMADMRSEVPRHPEERHEMKAQGLLLGTSEHCALMEEAPRMKPRRSRERDGSLVLLGQRNEAEEESGKRSEMQYEWMKRPEESEASYEKRLRLMDRDLRKEAKEALRHAGRLARDKNIGRSQGEAKSKKKARTKPKVEAKNAEAGKAKPPMTDVGRPEGSVTEAGKAEESVTVGSGKSAMNQEVIDDEILQQVLKYKTDFFGGSFKPDEAKEMVKAIRERMARSKKVLLHRQEKLPTKDEKYEAEAAAAETGKPEEPAMDQEVNADYMKSFEHVKFNLHPRRLDLEEDSNKTTEPAADPNSISIQDDHVDRSKSALAKKTAEEEAKAYAWYRKYWESNCCNDCDHFEHNTVLSSMLFTHYAPENVPYNIVATLQIFSMKLKLTEDNPGGFELPLSVYGMVAVRDTLDSRRNILFSCDSTEAQELTQDDPFLHLTGPSRAIVSTDNVYFEIYLRVKGAAGSQDKPLITCVPCYAGGCGTPLCFDNIFCRLEVYLRTVKRVVQATIVGVQIVRKKELWPSNFKYGGLVACTPLPLPRMTAAGSGGNDEKQIVLLESKGTKMPQGDSGYLHLWRQVVSVERGGGLDVVIQAYEKSGAVGAQERVHFKAKNCQVSQQQCVVGHAQVTVAVAWSVVPTDMEDVAFNF